MKLEDTITEIETAITHYQDGLLSGLEAYTRIVGALAKTDISVLHREHDEVMGVPDSIDPGAAIEAAIFPGN